MQQTNQDMILGVCSMAVIIGAAIRHFIPLVFKPGFWKFSKSRLEDNSVYLSVGNHEKLCHPIRIDLENGKKQVSAISSEIRYLRALAVIQAPPEALRKAEEITGERPF